MDLTGVLVIDGAEVPEDQLERSYRSARKLPTGGPGRT